MIDPKLKEWASDIQARNIDLVIEHGSMRAAAMAAGIDESSLRKSLKRLQISAAQRGYSPDHDMKRTVPAGYLVKGVSTLYDEDGKVRAQWVKSSLDDSKRQENLQAVVDALKEEVVGLGPITPAPLTSLDDLLAIYPLGDPHFGMLAWGKECGEAFDLKEAERVTFAAVDRLVQAAPSASTAIVLPLGDVFHGNDHSNQTPAHKNVMDVDTRHVNVLGVGIKTFRRVIVRALEKHRRVVVRFVAGNHDPEAIWALAFTIAAYFDNEPRVEVDLSPAKHWFYRFGKVLIGATHGDTTKHDRLLGVMAADRPEDWGLTKHRYFYTGHVHSQNVTELPGLVCESFRTLAAKDAYAAGHGYRAGRDMRCIVMHKEHGEVERLRCDVGMLEPA